MPGICSYTEVWLEGCNCVCLACKKSQVQSLISPVKGPWVESGAKDWSEETMVGCCQSEYAERGLIREGNLIIDQFKKQTKTKQRSENDVWIGESLDQ